MPTPRDNSGENRLVRGIGLREAVALNTIDMIGVGPFITIPLIVAAMGGPQAILGWLAGAAIVICDGLVWAELGAAMPGSGGSYRYLKEIYNPKGFGRVMAFLFIWQLSFSAPLSIASGCLGFAQYAAYLFPALGKSIVAVDLRPSLPLLGTFSLSLAITPGTFVAMGVCAVAVFLLYRRIGVIGTLAKYLWVGVAVTILWVIGAGVSHFDSARAFSFPPGAFSLTPQFFNGLGAGMLVAIYDYWGYYNVCFIGGEVRDPGKTIPRAILYSILIVGVIYLVMNISILGVVPWQELGESASSDARRYVVSVFMERIFGGWAGKAVTVLILWTAFASIFSLLLGYSRVPYAAAIEGDYFKPFAHVHSEFKIPDVSLIVLGAVAMIFCTLRLSDVIAALVVIRLLIQFLSQTVGVIVLRNRRPEMERPFRMWFYPLPAIIAFLGFVYVLVMRPDFLKEIRYALLLVVVGGGLYAFRAYRRSHRPQ